MTSYSNKITSDKRQNQYYNFLLPLLSYLTIRHKIEKKL